MLIEFALFLVFEKSMCEKTLPIGCERGIGFTALIPDEKVSAWKTDKLFHRSFGLERSTMDYHQINHPVTLEMIDCGLIVDRRPLTRDGRPFWRMIVLGSQFSENFETVSELYAESFLG
jgi:hypothetical protein